MPAVEPDAPEIEWQFARATGLADAMLGDLPLVLRKASLQALVRAWAARVQELEDAIWQLEFEGSIENATGHRLDLIGALLGMPRVVAAVGNDDIYENDLLAMALARLGPASASLVVRVVRQCFDDLVTEVRYVEDSAGFVVEWRTVDDDVDPSARAQELSLLLRAARAAGVAGQVTIPSAPPVTDAPFQFALGAYDVEWEAVAARGFDGLASPFFQTGGLLATVVT